MKRLTASVNVAGLANGLNRREHAATVKRFLKATASMSTDWKTWACSTSGISITSPGVRIHWQRWTQDKSGSRESAGESDVHRQSHIAVKGCRAHKQRRMEVQGRSSGTDSNLHFQRENHRDIEPVRKTPSSERRFMLSHYHVVTAAHRVVGVGSVGTRAYLVLLLGNGDDDPLFLQVKESVMAAQARYLPRLGKELMYNGKRVVVGQRALQASSDPCWVIPRPTVAITMCGR